MNFARKQNENFCATTRFPFTGSTSDMTRPIPKWGDDFLFASQDTIREVQEKNFAATLDLCFSSHPYYRQVFEKRGLRREDIRSLADLHKIPVISKADIADDPQSFVLQATDVPEEMRVQWDVMYTTGTTSGKPTPFVTTTYDFYRLIRISARMMQLRNVRDGDIFANLFPMTVYPYGGFHRTMVASYATKLPIVSPLPGNASDFLDASSSSEDVVRTVEKTGATILWGVASYVRRLLSIAEEAGADFSAVRMIFVTGEPVSEDMRTDFEDRLRRLGAKDPWLCISYGATEMQAGCIECDRENGLHNPAPEEFYFEVVDPDSHEPLPDGSPGLVLLTHLNRRGTVLLRYSLGDISTRTREKCPNCGALTDRFITAPRRADQLIKIRGMLVNPDILVDLLAGHPGIAEYQIVVEPGSGDAALEQLRVRVAPTKDGDAAALEEELKAAIVEAVHVRPVFEWTEPDNIVGVKGAIKTKRFIDKR